MKEQRLPNKGNLIEVQGYQLNTAQRAAKAHCYRCLPLFSMCHAPKKHICVVHVCVDHNAFNEYKHIVFAVGQRDRVQAQHSDQLTASAGLKFIRPNIKQEIIKYMYKMIVLYDITGHLYR